MEQQPSASYRPKGCGRFLLDAEKILSRMAALYGMPIGEPKRYFLQMKDDEMNDSEEKQPPKQ